jgi:peptide/nickel transport system ATP-binding protein
VSPPLLEVRDYHVGFRTPMGRARAVDGVSFTLDAGHTLGVVGESGSGKSVLSRSIMGLLSGHQHLEEGSVRLDGEELCGQDRQHLWGRRIAMIFQDPMTSLNPVMRIGTQVAEPLRLHLGMGRSEARVAATELLRSVGIPDPAARLRRYPHELSGGMRQRVMIAMALAAEPDLLIADEPTTALDVTVQKDILDLLGALQVERAMATVLITHDVGIARGRTDEVMVLYGGRVMEHAATPSLFAHTRHPYTEALLGAVPSLRQRKHTRLAPIPGTPPDIVDPPPGCRFAPRCKYAQPRCIAEEPPLVDLGDSHECACFHPVGTDAGAAALALNRAAGRTAAGLPMINVELGR